jgi:hypothetical protein
MMKPGAHTTIVDGAAAATLQAAYGGRLAGPGRDRVVS